MTAIEPSKRGAKVRWLYERLRTLIESEQWPDGYLIPSQAVLAEQYGMSVRTARDAVTLLVEDGLALRNQGKRTRVYQPDPPHQIAVHQRLDPKGRVAEPGLRVVSFLQGLETGPIRRHWDVDTVRMTGRDGRRLGVEAGTTVLRRALIVSIGGAPVLASNSFVPADVAAAAGDAGGWRDAEVGDLALSGLPVKSGTVSVHSRSPTLAEAKALAIARGIPVFVFSRPYRVFPGADSTRSRPAGVLVVARSDRVYWVP
jgi:GntR family transcriptional regulator